MKKLLILCAVLLSISACLKKEENKQEITKQPAPVEEIDKNTVFSFDINTNKTVKVGTSQAFLQRKSINFLKE